MDLKQKFLRENIGIVQQNVFLFDSTIRDNIMYGNPNATEEQLIEAAQKANIYDFIQSLPEGFDAFVGERGVKLSGGQKQRIAIARALLISPRILILDDSTSAVDMETEAKIQAALDEQFADCTTFIIAQRISSVLSADQIFVLDQGEIAAQGTHAELLESSPIYEDIFTSQLGTY